MQCNPAISKQRLRNSVSRLALVAALATSLGACANKPNSGDITGSIRNPFAATETNPQSEIERLGERYKQNPSDTEAAISYAQALRRNEQNAQAVAVLEQATIKNPQHKALAGEYGRALAEAGRLQQALEVLSRAHTPDQPDWRILNAQGAIHDQLGNYKAARRYYQSALKIAPEEPSVLSNLGLSYILSKELKLAESTLRRASANPRAEKRVRQNLALSLALQGKFDEAEKIAAGDLPPEEARANIAALRDLIKQQQQPRNMQRSQS
ncbi:MAG: tetratricopeptide repeat protein [Xanthobacteraceae bacterium]|nr:tetratricopeptide repeat protein [Xanthobacteraceae bacterium]